MPAPTSERFGMILPVGGDGPPDVPADHAQAFGQIDRQGAIDDQGVYASRPTANPARRGMYYWATDREVLYRCNGTKWVAFQPTSTSAVVYELPSAATVERGERRLYSPQGSTVSWDMVAGAGVQWRFAGGSPLVANATTATSIPVNGASFVALVESVPYAGSYMVDLDVQGSTNSGNRGIVWEAYVQQGSTQQTGATAVIPPIPGVAVASSWGRIHDRRGVSLAPGTVAVGVRAFMLDSSSASMVNVQRAHISLTPITLNGPA